MTSMEESSAMTIEFLRARLLSERSVSKSARQRADELAKRVAELEEQLNFVSLQRKKAERATADVLAILENRGISDVSEEFDSNSEQDETPRDFKSDNGSLTMQEASANTKPRNNEAEVYSSSEIESSPSTGRSLSWKSTKDPQHSLEKKKYIESVRRRASFTSNSSSARRIGKSCRRIRRRETRSMEELQNDGNEKTTRSADVSNCFDNGSVALREGSGFNNGKEQQENTELGPDSETPKDNGHYYSGHERDEDMESALQHQAQLIGRYEEEEKAQREWEEKFRESNNGAQESGDPGNHSDVTEERYEMELPKVSSHAAEASSSDNPEINKLKLTDAPSCGEYQTSKSLPTPTDADKGSFPDEKCSGGVEASTSEFSFPLTKEKSIQQFSVKHLEASELSRQQWLLPTHGTSVPPSTMPNWISTAPYAVPGSSSSLNLAVVPRETSNNLGSVLEALQQAKLSLNQKLHYLPPVAREASVNNAINPSNLDAHNVDRFNVPVVSPGLFRLPTDTQFEATTRTNPRPGTQLSLANYLPETVPGKFVSEPYIPSRSTSFNDLFHTTPYRSSFSPEFRPGASPQRSFSQPRLSEGSPSFYRMNHLDPYPLVEDTYPYLPDITFRLPLNDEVPSRTFPSSESGLPPPVRHLSSFNNSFRPNMHYR